VAKGAGLAGLAPGRRWGPLAGWALESGWAPLRRRDTKSGYLIFGTFTGRK
jgi:hypothetical protein